MVEGVILQMREIVKQGQVLARHIVSDDIHEGLNFYSQDEELIQVGAWGHGEGQELLAHIHNEVPRIVMRTCETLYVISGTLEVAIYDLKGNVIHADEIPFAYQEAYSIIPDSVGEIIYSIVCE